MQVDPTGRGVARGTRLICMHGLKLSMINRFLSQVYLCYFKHTELRVEVIQMSFWLKD